MHSRWSGSGAPPPDVTRVLLAAALMMGALSLHNYLFPAPAPETKAPPASAAKKASPPRKAVLVDEGDSGVKSSPSSSPVLQQPPQPPVLTRVFTVAPTEQTLFSPATAYQATLSTQGGQLRRVVLTGYASPVVLTGGPHRNESLLTLTSRNSDITLTPRSRYAITQQGDTNITLRHTTPEGVEVTRHYAFSSRRFVVAHTVSVRNVGPKLRRIALNTAVTDVSDPESDKGGWFTPPKDDSKAICLSAGKLRRWSWEDLKTPQQEPESGTDYAGFDKRYFLLALISAAQETDQRCGCAVSRQERDGEKTMTTRLRHPVIDLAPGSTATFSTRLYMGPKQLDLLRAAHPNLEQSVDFGFFGVLSRPLLWLLLVLHRFAHNFGTAIILLTVVIKLLTFPLTWKSMASMQQMKTLAPRVKLLQERYGHDRALLGQKQMDLYREAGVNPAGGCLPMLIQMPIWFALYQMLWNSVELYGQPFILWVTDLTKPDPYYTLPLAAGASMLIQQALQPPEAQQPEMKYVLWGMPIVFTVVMMNMPAGLSLYVFVNTLLTFLQQTYIKRKHGNA
ncbi:MAG: membrane protein insertase YidC [Myxococcota bacterium]